jgi:hypothetical protein
MSSSLNHKRICNAFTLLSQHDTNPGKSDSKSSDRKVVEVQVLSPVLNFPCAWILGTIDYDLPVPAGCKSAASGRCGVRRSFAKAA